MEKIVDYDDYGDFRLLVYDDPDDGTQDLRLMGVYRFADQLCDAFSDLEGES